MTAILGKAELEWDHVQSAFYATFEGFESFYKMGAYRNFSERLGGLILEGGLYTELYSTERIELKFSLKIALFSTGVLQISCNIA